MWKVWFVCLVSCAPLVAQSRPCSPRIDTEDNFRLRQLLPYDFDAEVFAPSEAQQPLDLQDASTPSKPPIQIVSLSPSHTDKSERYQWKPALLESLEFLGVEHSYRIEDGKWVRYNLTHGKFFQKWFDSVHLHSWDDGDNFLSTYVGHPMQGAVAGYIEIQNDPSGRFLKIGKSRAYWNSRMKAMAWAATFSVVTKVGPISEASIGNLGSYQYLGDNGKITDGTGVNDWVVSPVGGFLWMIAEDTLDKYVSNPLSRKYHNNMACRIVRGGINPSRTMANLLRFKSPWYRGRTATEVIAADEQDQKSR